MNVKLIHVNDLQTGDRAALAGNLIVVISTIRTEGKTTTIRFFEPHSTIMQTVSLPPHRHALLYQRPDTILPPSCQVEPLRVPYTPCTTP